MNYLKILLAGLLGSVISFLGGWVLYGMILEPIMEKYVREDGKNIYLQEPGLGGIFLSGLLYSIMLAYVCEGMKIRSAAAGITTGAILGLLVAASMDVSLYSMTKLYNSMMVIPVDMAGNLVLSALMGAGIGWFLGYKRAD
jgi:hypothetical protein